METGNFGKVKDAYAEVRQAFPQEVIDFIWHRIPKIQPKILDLGCGTGIATRQLADLQGTSIIGCDIDQQMIKAAQEVPVSNITYAVSPAYHLPFALEEFDAITAFSAFHWFKDKKSLTEIQRVLKKGSGFFVINKNDIGGFRKGYKRKLAKFIGKKLLNPKDDYDPVKILKEAGFEDVMVKVFQSKERFSVNEAIRHIQSAASWGEVPAKKEKEAIKLMKDHIAQTMVNNQAIREIEVVVVSGKKKQ